MKFWVIGCDIMHKVMWEDVKKLDYAFYIDSIFRNVCKVKLWICKILIEFDKREKLPKYLRKLAYSVYTLSRLDFGSAKNFIILTDNRVGWYSLNFLKYLKVCYNIHYVLIYLNPYITSGDEVLRFKEMADYVFSYDINDVQKYGFEYFTTIYSGLPTSLLTNQMESDIMYFGGENGRLDLLIRCFEEIDKHGLKYDFNIVSVKKKQQVYSGKINYCKPIPYYDLVNKEKTTNCILEVLSEKQSGTTLRAMEAVVLNKKLLTNNVNIINLPFFNEKFMKVFTEPGDIDWEFVQKVEEVNYDYHNECSPIKIIERIKQLEQTVN